MNTKLITALRTAAKSIDLGTFAYTWNDPMRCNCGILACSLLGKSPREMVGIATDMPRDDHKNQTWTHYAATVCPITGMPEHKLFKTLFSHGLTQAEFHHLEYLSEPEIRARMDMRAVKPAGWLARFLNLEPKREEIDFRNGSHVARYMRAWAQLLEERGRADHSEVHEEETTNALMPK